MQDIVLTQNYIVDVEYLEVVECRHMLSNEILGK